MYAAAAIITLLDKTARLEIENVVKRIHKVETAVEPKFQDHFVEALAIPHKTATYENLRGAVELPEPVRSSTEPGGRQRRRKGRPTNPPDAS